MMERHNHMSRDIKPLGKCPACDEYHERHIPKPKEKSTYRKLEEEVVKLRTIANQLERWRSAWASQDTSDSEPARKAMFKALDYWLESEEKTQDNESCTNEK